MRAQPARWESLTHLLTIKLYKLLTVLNGLLILRFFNKNALLFLIIIHDKWADILPVKKNINTSLKTRNKMCIQ